MDAMRDVPRDRKQLAISAAVAEGQVHLRFADHGPGIAPEHQARLFEPFFTTKSEGMGMGLNICRSIIEGHKGRLWLETNPAGGCIFHVLLPCKRR
jgi:signal transduction histidine kinase